MNDNIDNSWLSDRTKTIVVTVTMTILVGGMAWGYYAGYQWKQEREAEAWRIEQTIIMEGLLEAEKEQIELDEQN